MDTTKRPELVKSRIVEEMPEACSSEIAAVEFLERKRWGDKPMCAHCWTNDVYQMKNRNTGERSGRFLWRCRTCKKQFTVRTNTVFEESLIPLQKWCRAFWEASSSKNGVSALEISRKLQISYKSALFMMHRVRHIMAMDGTTPPKLSGVVEMDETYVGGKPRHTGWDKTGKSKKNRAQWTTKTPVVATVERGGIVRARVVADVTSKNLARVLAAHVQPGTHVMTDDRAAYRKLVRPLPGQHSVVQHSYGEYVQPGTNPLVHTNTVEGFFSRVKRQLNGTYHAVSKTHLHRYIDQSEWLYNQKERNDGDRIVTLIKSAVGKRLTYKDQTGAA